MQWTDTHPVNTPWWHRITCESSYKTEEACSKMCYTRVHSRKSPIQTHWDQGCSGNRNVLISETILFVYKPKYFLFNAQQNICGRDSFGDLDK